MLMQWKHFCLGSCTIIEILFVVSALYAYKVNARKTPDDPSKRDYSPYAIWISPVFFPLIIVLNVFLFVFFVFLFGIFLLLFPFALLFVRKPFLFKWIGKQLLKIGNFALKVNTELLKRLGLSPISNHPSA